MYTSLDYRLADVQRGVNMAHYLVQVSYNNQGISDLVNNPQDRSTHIGSVIESLGGRMELFTTPSVTMTL